MPMIIKKYIFLLPWILPGGTLFTMMPPWRVCCTRNCTGVKHYTVQSGRGTWIYIMFNIYKTVQNWKKKKTIGARNQKD